MLERGFVTVTCRVPSGVDLLPDPGCWESVPHPY
jgi:hypothetical protein